MTKEETKEYNKEYYKKNKNIILENVKLYSIECKDKISASSKRYRRSKKGLINQIYGSQKTRSKKRGHKLPTYTKKELKEWLYSETQFDALYNVWVVNDFNKNFTPSIDRKNDNIGYTMENIQLMTWEENNAKAYKNRKKGKYDKRNKPVVQFTKEGVFVKEWYSIKEASSKGFHDGCISYCCKRKLKTHKGFIWKYKKED